MNLSCPLLTGATQYLALWLVLALHRARTFTLRVAPNRVRDQQRADTRMGCRMTTLAMRLLVLHRLLHTRLYAVERLHMPLYFWLATGAKVMQGLYSPLSSV